MSPTKASPEQSSLRWLGYARTLSPKSTFGKPFNGRIDRTNGFSWHAGDSYDIEAVPMENYVPVTDRGFDVTEPVSYSLAQLGDVPYAGVT